MPQTKIRKARQTSMTSARASGDMRRRRERGRGGGGGRRGASSRRPSGLRKDVKRTTDWETESLVTKRALMVLAYRRTSDCEWLQANGFNDPLPQTLEDMGIDINKVIETFSTSETHLTKSIIPLEKKDSCYRRRKSDDLVRQQAVTYDEIRRLEQQLKSPESKELRLKKSMLYTQMQCGSYQQPENSSQKRNTQNENTKDTRQRSRRSQGNDQRSNSLSHHSDQPENRKTRNKPQKVNSILQNNRDFDQKQNSQQKDEQRCKEEHQHLNLSIGEVNIGTLSVEDFVARYRPSIVITRIGPKSFPNQNQTSDPKSTKVSVQDANRFQDKNKCDRSKGTKLVSATKIKTKRLRGPSLSQSQSHKIETVQQRTGRAPNLKSVVPNKDKQTRGGKQFETPCKYNPKKEEFSTNKKHKQNQNREYGSDIAEHVNQKRADRSHDLILRHIHDHQPVTKHDITSKHKEFKEESRVYSVRNLTKNHSLESSENFNKKSSIDQRQNFVKVPEIDQVHMKQTPLSKFKRDFKHKHLSHFSQGFTKEVTLESARDQSQTLMSDKERHIDQQGKVIIKPAINQDCTVQSKQDSVIKLPSGSKVFFSRRQLPKRSQISYDHNVGIQDHIPDRKQDPTQIQTHKHEQFCDQEQNQNQKQGFPQKHTLNQKLGTNQKSISLSGRNLNQEHKADQNQDSEDDTLDYNPQVIPYQGEDALDQIPQLIPYKEETASDRKPHLTPYQEPDTSDHIPQLIPDHKLMYISEIKSGCDENSKAGHTPRSNVIQQNDHVTESRKTDNPNKDLILPHHSGSASNKNFSGKNVYRQTKVKEPSTPGIPTSILKFIATKTHQKSSVEKKRKRSNDMEEGPRKVKSKTSNAGAVSSESGVNEMTFKLQNKIVNAPIISYQQFKAKDFASAGSCSSAQNHEYSVNSFAPKSPRCENTGRVSPVGIHDVMTRQLHLEKTCGQQNATMINSKAHNTSTFARQLANQFVNDSRNVNIISNSKTYSQQRKHTNQKKRRKSSTDFAQLPASSEIPSAKRSRQDVEHCPLSCRKSNCDDKANYLTNQCSDSNSHYSLLANPSTIPLSPLLSSNQLDKPSIGSNKSTNEYDFPSLLDNSGVKFKVPKKTPDNQNFVLKDEAIDAANLENSHSHQSPILINQHSGISNSSNKQIIKVKRHLNNSTPLSYELHNHSTVDGRSGSVIKTKNVDEEILHGGLRNNCTRLEKYQRKFEHRFQDLKDRPKFFQSQLSTDKKYSGTDKSDTDDVHSLGCKKKYSGPKVRKRNPEKIYSNKEWGKNSNNNQATFIKINTGGTKKEYRKLKNKSNSMDKEISNPKKNIVIQPKHPTVSSYLNQAFTSNIQLSSSSRVQSRNSYSPSTPLKGISSNPEHHKLDVDNAFSYKDELKNRSTQRSIFNNQLSNAVILPSNEHILNSQFSSPTSQRGISGSQSYVFDSRPRISNDRFKIRTKIVTPGCQPVISKSLPIVRGCHPIVSDEQVTGSVIQHNIVKKSSPSKCHSISHPNQSSIHRILTCDSNNVLTISVNYNNSPVISLAGQHTPGSHLCTPESQSININQYYISPSHLMSHASLLFIPINQSSVSDTRHSDTNSQLRVFYGQSNIPTYGSTSNINQLEMRDSILHGQSGIPVVRFVTHINQPTNNIQLFGPGHHSRFLYIQSSASKGQLGLPNSQYIISNVQPIITPISYCGILNTQYTIPCSLLRFVGVDFDEVNDQNNSLRNQLPFMCNRLTNLGRPIDLDGQRNTLGSQPQLRNTNSLPGIMSDSPSSNLSDPSSQTVNVQSIIPGNSHYVHTSQFDDLTYQPFHSGTDIFISCGQPDQSWNRKQNLRHPFGHPSNQLHVSSLPDEEVGKFENLGSQSSEPSSLNLFMYSAGHLESPYDQRCYPWSQFYQSNNQVPYRNNIEFDYGNQYYHSFDHLCASLRQSDNERYQPSASKSERGNINSDSQSQISMVTSKSDILSDLSISRNNQDGPSSTATSPNTTGLARDMDLLLSLSTEPNPLNDNESAMSTDVVKTTNSNSGRPFTNPL